MLVLGVLQLLRGWRLVGLAELCHAAACCAVTLLQLLLDRMLRLELRCRHHRPCHPSHLSCRAGGALGVIRRDQLALLTRRRLQRMRRPVRKSGTSSVLAATSPVEVAAGSATGCGVGAVASRAALCTSIDSCSCERSSGSTCVSIVDCTGCIAPLSPPPPFPPMSKHLS
jgi:hypothetical protein